MIKDWKEYKESFFTEWASIIIELELFRKMENWELPINPLRFHIE